MATPEQLDALVRIYHGAVASGHIFPAAAACEGADESRWGTTDLFLKANNVFGCKQHVHPFYGTIRLPTKEFLHGEWETEVDAFVSYPTLVESFTDRMHTLEIMAPKYPHYAAALAASTAEGYLLEVSRSWSTNPSRAIDCMAILHAHRDIFK